MGQIRRQYFEVLKWALGLLIFILPCLSWANDCRWILANLGESKTDRIQFYISDLKNESASVRWRAVKALAQANDPSLRSHLINLLSDPDSRIRDTIIEALKSWRDDSLFQELTRLYQDADVSLRKAVIESLWKIHDKRALPLLLNSSTDEDPDVRWFAVIALGDLKNQKAIPAILKRLSDSDSRVQWVAIRALVKYQDPRLAAFLIPMLGHATTEVQTSAAWAIGELQATELIFQLEMALENEDFQVRWASAEALGKMASPEAFEPLLKALKDEDEYVQSQAVKSLARIQDPRVISVFKRLLSEFSDHHSLQLTIKEALRSLKNDFSDKKLKKYIDLVLLNFDFQDQIEHLTGIQLDRILFNADESSHKNFNFVVSTLQKNQPHLIPGGEFRFLWDHVKKLNSALQLLQLYFQESLLKIERENKDIEIPSDSLSLLESALGISLEEIRQDQKLQKPKISKNALGDFYELALDLVLRTKQSSILNSFEITNLANRSSFSAFSNILLGLRDLAALRSQEIDLWPKIKTQIDLSKTNFEEINFQIQRLRFLEIQRLFGESFSDFNLEKIKELSLRWGDLRPIFTLLSRYQGENNSEVEIQELYAIFDSVLKDRFFEYKFQGERFDDQERLMAPQAHLSSEPAMARNQLSSLKSPAAFSGWTKIRNQLQFYDQEKLSSSLEQKLRDLKSIVESNLLLHLPRPKTTSSSLPSLIHQSLEFSGNYEEKWNMILSRADRKISPEDVFYAAALEMLLVKDFLVFKKIHALLKNWIKLPGISLRKNQDLKADLDEIDLKIIQAGGPFRRTASSSQGFVFTTSVQDAKSLLMIGSCIRGVSSCQNYQTGTHIQSLLGYVKDAHVQATLSFFINASHFSRAQDYQALVMAQQEGQLLQAEFLPESFRIRFFWDDQEVITQSLESAQRRHILKLGRMENSTPGLFLERAYKVNHPAQALMEAQTERLLEEIAADIGGRIKRKSKGPALRIAASRHLSGHYSDAAGGPQIQAYIIR